MSRIVQLPTTREEYTMWSLEWTGRFRTRYLDYLDHNSESMTALLAWIDYTVDTYPDLVLIELSINTFMITVAGVLLYSWGDNEIILCRRILDHPETKKRRLSNVEHSGNIR